MRRRKSKSEQEYENQRHRAALKDLRDSLWMTWYKGKWPWDWIDNPQTDYSIARNWKSFAILPLEKNP